MLWFCLKTQILLLIKKQISLFINPDPLPFSDKAVILPLRSTQTFHVLAQFHFLERVPSRQTWSAVITVQPVCGTCAQTPANTNSPCFSHLATNLLIHPEESSEVHTATRRECSALKILLSRCKFEKRREREREGEREMEKKKSCL